MPIVSYAQNFEDVILWRVLQHIANGFYIDIGAQHPTVDSVSKAFYEKKWHGIHVEPTTQYANLLRQDRPDEVVIQAAVSDARALIPLYEFADTGLSTLDEQIAQRHIQAGFKVNQISIPAITLDDVFSSCAQQDIHWLKIDVEGHERQVLSGWKDSPQRPWIIIVESTLPLTQQESYSSWDGILVQKGYQFVYFDGLNRFYVSKAKPELISESWIPPNVFDGFLIHGTASNVISQSFTQRLTHVEESYQAELAQQIERHQQEQLLLQEREQTLLNEIAALKNSIHDEQRKAKTAEIEFKQQVDGARNELGQMVRLISNREQEFAKQHQLSLQEQKERYEQSVASEQSAAASLAQAHEQLKELEHSWLQREHVLREQAATAQAQLQTLNDSLRQKEQTFATQLLQVHKEKAGQANAFNMIEQSLRKEIVAVQQKISSIQQERDLTVQELQHQLLSLRQQIESLLEQQVTASIEYQHKLESQQKEALLAQQRLSEELSNAQQRALAASQTYEVKLDAVRQEAASATQAYEIKLDIVRQEVISTAKIYESKLESVRLEASEAQESIQSTLLVVQDDAQKREQEHALILRAAEQRTQGCIESLQQKEKHIAALLEQHEKNLQERQQQEMAFNEQQQLKEAALAEILRIHADNIAKLNQEIEAAQKVNHQLKISLNALYAELVYIKASLSWRLSKPFRVLYEWIQPSSVMPVFDGAAQESMTWQTHMLPPALTQHSTAIESFFMQIASELAGQIQPASNINELLNFHGDYFIRCVFLTFILREPNAEEMAHWRYALSTGRSKPRIIAEIVRTHEGRDKNVNLPGLKRLLKRDKISHFPLIGWYFARKFHIEGNAPADKHIRIIETQLFQLSKLIMIRFDEQDQKIKALQSTGEQQYKHLSELLVSKNSNVSSVSADNNESNNIVKSPALEAELNRMSVNARVIYKKLNTAIAARA